ncbi:hypothetical protein [Shouchella lehensis]|uniref:Orn/DAP/Arg decarboxylase n=1 Tax=Shouchella lehensis G1 TaxID=1246626 RepID=A0A060M679_9BACI|nr:hypothetical protein [Shouchella lehensis]AIC96048.1 Orn/DAP/Arg decarboxylase [Shouchella lehensis G1]
MSLFPELPQNMLHRSNEIKSPAVVYDAESLTHVVNHLRRRLGSVKKMKLYVSMKANRNVGLNAYMSKVVDGVDVSSYEEYQVATVAGYSRISATSPGIKIEHIHEMIENHVQFDFDNVEQLYAYSCQYNESRQPKDIGLRLNIPIESNGATTYLSKSRFGINVSQSDNQQALKEILKEFHYKVTSIHIHIGELNNFNTVKDTLNYLVDILSLFPDVQTLNLGGGLTRLFSNEEDLDNTFELIQSYTEQYLPKLKEVIFEPGMLVYVMAGYLKTSVLSVNNGVVNMDSSAWNLIEWTKGNVKIVYTSSNGEVEQQTIAGNTCYEKDIYFENTASNKLSLNDYIVLFPFGAYTVSMSKSLHGLPSPKEYLYINDEFTELSVGEGQVHA